MRTGDASLALAKQWPKSIIEAILRDLETIGDRGTCIKRKVGAAVVSEDGAILLAAANGTPPGMRPCNEGGCIRCNSSGQFPHGTGYDLCICLHAEQAVLLGALSRGLAVQGNYLATGYQPCFMCAKLIVGAGFLGVRYVEPWLVPESDSRLPNLAENYSAFWAQIPAGCIVFDSKNCP
jgi:dCMP deaminase